MYYDKSLADLIVSHSNFSSFNLPIVVLFVFMRFIQFSGKIMYVFRFVGFLFSVFEFQFRYLA